LACRHSIEYIQKNKRYKMFFKPSILDKYPEYSKFPRNITLITFLDQIDAGMFNTFEQFHSVISRHFITIANLVDPDNDPLLIFNRCAAATDEILEELDKLDTSVSLELSKIFQEKEMQAKINKQLKSSNNINLTTTTTTTTSTTTTTTTTNGTNSTNGLNSTNTINKEIEIDSKLVDNFLDELVSSTSNHSLTKLLEVASRIRSAIHLNLHSSQSKQNAFENLKSNFKQFL